MTFYVSKYYYYDDFGTLPNEESIFIIPRYARLLLMARVLWCWLVRHLPLAPAARSSSSRGMNDARAMVTKLWRMQWQCLRQDV